MTDEEVMEIIRRMNDEIKNKLVEEFEVATKKPNSPAGCSYGFHPVTGFNHVHTCIFTEGCIPTKKAAFLATNDCSFARVVTRPPVDKIYSCVVGDILGICVVLKVCTEQSERTYRCIDFRHCMYMYNNQIW